MRPEDAIRPLKELSDRKKMADQCDQASASDIRLYHALDTAIVALDKQIPKKPEKEAEDNLLCPACSGFLGYESECKEEPYQLPYCSGCGQAIDWTDWEK